MFVLLLCIITLMRPYTPTSLVLTSWRNHGPIHVASDMPGSEYRQAQNRDCVRLAVVTRPPEAPVCVVRETVAATRFPLDVAAHPWETPKRIRFDGPRHSGHLADRFTMSGGR